MSHTLELLSTIEHGTVAGYRAGCHGSAVSCGAVVSCATVYVRYQADWGFRKRVNAGEDPADIFAAELADQDAVRERDKVANRAAKAEGARAAHAREMKQRTQRTGIPPQQILDGVRDLSEKGATLEDMAQALSISKSTVMRAKHTLGIVGRIRRKVDRAEVERLHALGWTDVRIAVELNVDPSAVGKARAQLGLGVNRQGKVVAPSERAVRREKLRELHAEGLTDGQIAERLGISRTAAQQTRARLKLPVNADRRGGYGPHRSKDTRDAIERLHAEGRTDAEMAEQLGFTYTYIAGIRRELGLPLIRSTRSKWDTQEVKGHGTTASYARGCRCEPCKTASRTYHREYVARRKEQDAGEHHGTAYGYQLGCRGKGCPSSPSCTQVMLEQDRARRRAAGVQEKVFVDAAPVAAHVRGLMAAGLTTQGVATAAGVPFATVKSLIHSRGADRGPVVSLLADRARAILAVPFPEVTR